MKLLKLSKKIFDRVETSSLLPVVLLTICVLASSWSLLHPGLGVGHDLNHQARIYEMARGLLDGNFPVIWSQNLAYGYGMPLFEFYAPLPYLIGSLFYLLGFSLQQSVELMMLLGTVVTTVGAYLLAKKLFNSVWAAILVSAVITLAPYRAVDVFVRTAISEAWAIAWIPFVLLGVIKVVRNERSGWLIMAASFAALIMSHNLTALMALPFIALFAVGYLLLFCPAWKERFTALWKLFISGVLGLGLAAFYFLPALAEKNFTTVDEFTLSSYYDFRQHFLYIRQFLEPWGAWEFGGSGWGPNDEMSFFLGFAQLLIIAVAVVQLGWLAVFYKKSKALLQLGWLQLLFLILTGGSLVLTLLKVQPLWEAFSFTAYFQFPWRFLAVTVVFGGLLAGSIYQLMPVKYRPAVLVLILGLLFAFNPRYFQSEKYQDHTAKYQDYAAYIRAETSNNLYDYIPVQVNFFEKQGFYLYKNPIYGHIEAPVTTFLQSDFIATYQPIITSERSTKKSFAVSLPTETAVTTNIAYYPGWQAYVDEAAVETNPNENGLVTFIIPTGEHSVRIQLEDTPMRFWGKVLTTVSLGVVVLILFQKQFFNTKTSR